MNKSEQKRICTQSECVVRDELRRVIEQLQKDNKAKQEVIDKLVEGLRDIAGFLLCDGQDVEAIFNPNKKEVTEQINIIRALIKSIGEDE